MIIRTDLYAVLSEGQKRQRNPYRFVWLFAGLLLAGATIEYWLLLTARSDLKTQESRLESKAAQLAKEMVLAEAEAAKAATLRTQRAALLEFAYRRISWAPLLEGIFAAVPETLQLHSVKGSSPWQSDCTLQISGKATGEQPRLEADKFRSLCIDALADAGITAIGSFNKLEDTDATGPLAQSEFEITLRWMNTNAKGN